MSDTVQEARPKVSTSKRVALSSNERADHLADMDKMFSKAVREEMLETQRLIAALRAIPTRSAA